MLETDIFPIAALNNETWIFIFGVSIIIYYFLKKTILQVSFIISLSVIFAFAANQYNLGPITSLITVTLLNYWIYKNIHKYKFLLYFGITLNLGLLFFAKYFIFGTQLFGIETTLKQTTALFLFVGLSFYVFSMIASIVEGYKSGNSPTVSLSYFFMYALFFPRIIMGPIMKLSEFVTQIEYKHQIHGNLQLGLFLFMFGFAKKTLADFLFLYPNLVFLTPQGYAGSVHIVSIYAYGAQLYLDFSGYTDMALGLALMFGYKLNQNFNRPYLSTSITQFWQKWHITLSNWLKEHIYIPLGGSKNGLSKLYFALFMTFIVSGVWHGVGLNYLVWGLWHGLGIAIHKTWKNYDLKMPTFLGWILTFHFVIFGWILFIYNSFDDIYNVFDNLIYNFDIAVLPSVFLSNLPWTICFAIAWIMILLPTKTIDLIKQRILFAPWIVHFILVFLLFYASILVKTVVVAPFIYESF